MLTYEAKRNLAEAYLNEHARTEDDCWCWVSDMDENYVYFNLCDTYYKAAYSIVTEGDENTFTMDLENKERVVRSWATFVAEEESTKTEEGYGKVGCATEPVKVEEGCGKTEEGCGKTGCAVEPKAEEACGKTEEGCDKTSCAVEPAKVEEGCGKIGCEADPEPEKKTEAALQDDNNQNRDATIENVNTDVTHSAEFTATKPIADTPIEAPVEVAKFIVDGGELTGEELVNKYNELKSNFDALNITFEAENKKKLFTVGENVVNSEESLEDAEKQEFSAKIKSKIDAKELTTEEAVKTFAVGLVAVALYNKMQATKEEQKEMTVNFSKQEIPVVETKPEKDVASLKEATDKLNRI